MNTAARAAAYAVLVATAVGVVVDAFPPLGVTGSRTYTGALLLAGVAVVAFGLTATVWTTRVEIQVAAPSFAMGAAGLLIVGLVGNEITPADPAQLRATVRAIGLVIVLMINAILLFGTSLPTMTWSKLPVITTLVAIVMVLAYGAVILYMLNNAATEGATWDHLLVIFTAVQGIGLAAVGALLGTQVKQGEVNNAKAETMAAHEEAKTAKADVRRALELGRPLADAAAAANPATAHAAAQAAGGLEELRAKYRS